MKVLFLICISIYGLVHLLSFLWSYKLVTFNEFLYVADGRLKGLVSLLVFQFLGAGLLTMVFKNSNWWIWTLLAGIVSQLLVIGSWDHLKYASIINVGLIIISLIAFKSSSFEKAYHDDIKESIERTSKMPVEILTESDLVGLPLVVQSYLKTSGVVGKPKVYNMKVCFSGQMRSKEKDWFDFKSEQYNFFDIPQRNFFMKAKVKQLPTWGYHAFDNGVATMDVRALSTIPLVSIRGEKLNVSETVTLFNDMCILAPASLIDRRISWKSIDERSVEASFTNAGITITAKLYFNDRGQLINFISEDRYEINENRKMRFSTPLSNYKSMDGYSIPTRGEATWHYLDGPFAYGIFNLQSIEYNVKANSSKT